MMHRPKISRRTQADVEYSLALDVINTQRESNDRLAKALKDLSYGGEGQCWCGVAIGNPMYREHSAACLAAQEAMKKKGGVP